MTDELPPLPHPYYEDTGNGWTPQDDLWSKSQIQADGEACARAAVLAERERCAKVCEAEAESLGSGGKRDASALCCAAAIRAGTTKRPEPKPGA